jgi:hypothetical protein
MGDRSEKQDWAFIDGVWGGGVGFGGAVDCRKFFTLDLRKRLAGGSGVSGAGGERSRGEGGSGGVEALLWIWGAERVFAVYSAVSFGAGKIGKKRIG